MGAGGAACLSEHRWCRSVLKQVVTEGFGDNQGTTGGVLFDERTQFAPRKKARWSGRQMMGVNERAVRCSKSKRA